MIFRFPQPGAADAAGWWLAASVDAAVAPSSLLFLLPLPCNAAAAASVQA